MGYFKPKIFIINAGAIVNRPAVRIPEKITKLP
jgi:hypothetical protein